jgi:hypothetical protein
VGYKLCFWPMSCFGPDLAQKRRPPCPVRHPPRARFYADVLAMHSAACSHLRHAPLPLCCAPCYPEGVPSSSSTPSLPLAPLRASAERGRAMAASSSSSSSCRCHARYCTRCQAKLRPTVVARACSGAPLPPLVAREPPAALADAAAAPARRALVAGRPRATSSQVAGIIRCAPSACSSATSSSHRSTAPPAAGTDRFGVLCVEEEDGPRASIRRKGRVFLRTTDSFE